MTELLRQVRTFANAVRRIYTLMAAFNAKALIGVLVVLIASALLQIISVTLVFPFLSFVSEPESFAESSVGQIFFYLAPNSQVTSLIQVSAFVLAIAILVSNLFNLLADYVRTWYTWAFAHWLRSRMLRSTVDKPYAWFVEQNSSLLIKRLTQDLFQFSNGIIVPVLDGTSRLFLSVGLIITVIYVEPAISLAIAAVLVTTYLLVFFLMGSFRRRISDKMHQSWMEVFELSGQLIEGIKTIRMHNAERFYVDNILQRSKIHQSIQPKMPIVSNGPRYLIEPVLAGFILVVVVVSLGQSGTGSELVPVFGLIALALYRLLPSIQMLYAHLSNIQASLYLLDEVTSLLPEASEETEQFSEETSSVSFNRQIQLENIKLSLGRSGAILNDVNFTLESKECVAIVGETGAGKSTLIDVILGLRSPDSGVVKLDGVELKTAGDWTAWRAMVGYVPQDLFVADASIAANIAFGIAADAVDLDRVKNAAALAHLDSFIESELPEGYQTQVGEHGLRLSGGQRQRLAIARALYHEPSVLVFDEATSALDHKTEQSLMDVIFELRGGFTLLVVTHRQNSLDRMDRVLQMDAGTLS